jgi:hypothetical protein
VPALALNIKHLLLMALRAPAAHPLSPMANVPAVLREMIRNYVVIEAFRSTNSLREREKAEVRRPSTAEEGWKNRPKNICLWTTLILMFAPFTFNSLQVGPGQGFWASFTPAGWYRSIVSSSHVQSWLFRWLNENLPCVVEALFKGLRREFFIAHCECNCGYSRVYNAFVSYQLNKYHLVTFRNAIYHPVIAHWEASQLLGVA